ncbi:histidine kinase [Frankia sp. Mgl5]|uniref:DUF7134 domain-containing protein n=1 Tax=Frankia sp. Mgl5 TaxID=2933793 RepID=UPI00200F8417|nr:histidine kinase [Frankia sp. Mgl5]MCK9930883.1 histidine kinase [Frankia sp. Mgl5]
MIWAALRRHRERAGPASLTVWAWVADAILAVVLALGVVTAIHGDRLLAVPEQRASQVLSVERPDRPAPVPLAVPAPAPAPMLADPAEPADGWVPRRGGLVAPRLIAVRVSVAGWQLALAVLTALPLAARRRFPLATYGVVIAAAALLKLGVHIDDLTVFAFASCLIAGYSAAMYSPHRAWAAAGLAGGVVVLGVGHQASIPEIIPDYFPFLVLIPLGLAANAAHTRVQRARMQEAERAAASRLATDQERARIARELHDVVTHNLTSSPA